MKFLLWITGITLLQFVWTEFRLVVRAHYTRDRRSKAQIKEDEREALLATIRKQLYDLHKSLIEDESKLIETDIMVTKAYQKLIS